LSKDYAVGKRRPPVHSRYKKGQSGNPSGRPRRERRPPSIESALQNGLNQLVTINENGKLHQITKFEVVVTQLINKAATGHLQSIKLLMPFLVGFAEAAAAEDQEAKALADDESYKRITSRLSEMLRRKREAQALIEEQDLRRSPRKSD
jgi:hypothetical protein